MDYADNEVKGLVRYIPTTLAKSFLAAAFVAPLAAFQLVRGNPEWFLIGGLTALEQTLVATTSAMTVSSAFLFLLSLELALVVSKIRHGRIMHYSNVHPQMSFRWLKANASFKHYAVLILFGGFMFCIGLYGGQDA